MRVVDRAQTGRRRRTGWTGDRRGNMQVIEVMIVGLLVMAAVVAVSTMNVPVAETEGFKQDNERLTRDSLSAMLNRPSSSTLFGSTLEEFVMKAVAGDPGPLMDYLNKTLPGGAMYNVYLDNHYGPPYPVVKQGEPPREAVAGSVQLVPKLAYTFMVPEFGHYHGDFHMNMYSVPVQNGLLMRDEGEPIELAVTFQDVDDLGALVGEEVTLKTYSHTALRHNDATAREWPSVSISQWNHTHKDRRYVFDASWVQLYGERITDVSPLAGDAYNITWTMRFDETAGVKVPKNTQLTVELPRGFDFDEKRQGWLPVDEDLKNDLYWKDWTFEGSVNEGWTITIKTKDSFKSDAIWLNLSANFRSVLDTAYPYYSPITFSLGSGVQGLSHVLINTPSTPVLGAFGREAYLSVSKPLISGKEAHWGLAFGNNGADLVIHNITLRNPDGVATLTDVQGTSGWASGEWKPVAGSPGHFYWDPDGSAVVGDGSQMWLSFDVTAGTSGDNNYRNRDYLDVRARFNPENATGGIANALGEWEYDKRAWRMGTEWVYRDAIQPYDGSPSDYVPGWPDQEGRDYWVTGGTYGYQKVLAGNASFKVLPAAFGSNAFGGYEGAHVASELDIANLKGVQTRDFALGDKVHIRNDFSAVFAKLSELEAAGDLNVSDLTIRTSVYTPEKSWMGIPAQVFSDSASIANQFGAVDLLLSEDLNGDGIDDIVAVGGGGLAYALDGADGAKFWTISAGSEIHSASFVDVDETGIPELLLGLDNARLAAYNADPSDALADRELWVKDLTPNNPFGLGTYIVTDIVDSGSKGPGLPDTVVGVSSVTGEALVVGLETSADEAIKVSEHDASALTDTGAAFIYDLVRVDWADSGDPVPHVAYSSAKKTVTMLSLPDLERVWVERLPDTVTKLHAIDLDGDLHQDLVANTIGTNSLSVDGDKVYTLTSRSGNFAPKIRETVAGVNGPLDVAISQGGLFVTGNSSAIMATRYGAFEPAAQNLNGEYDSSDVANARGLHVAPNGTVYIAGGSGAVLIGSKPSQFATGWVWNVSVEDPGLTNIYDLHVSPMYPDGGPLYLVNKTGSIRSATDHPPTFTEIAHLVSSAAVPDAGLSGHRLELTDFQVEEDEDGEAVRFWITSHSAGSGLSRLHSYDIATATWTEEGSWSGHALGMLLEDDGTVWVAGDTDSRPTLWERPAGDAWRTHTLWRNTTGDILSSILVQEDGTAWASSTKGNVWTRTSDRLWVPIYIDGITNAGPTVLVEADNGEVWLVGDRYQHAPVTSYARTAIAEFELPSPPSSVVDVLIKANEGHLGGAAGPPSREATTQVEWFARGVGEDAWTKLAPQSLAPTMPDVYTMTHRSSITCTDLCGTIELRAVLNNTWSPGTNPEYTDGGATPGVRSFEATLDGGGEKLETKTVVDSTTLKPSSTAVYSSFHGGAVLPSDRLPWTYYGDEKPTGIDQQERLIATTETDLLTGEAAPHIVIVEENDGDLQRWVLNGTTGHPEAPSDLTSFGFSGSDMVRDLLITQMTGGSEPDVVMVGTFNDIRGSVLTWNVADDSDMRTSGDDSSNPKALVDSGLDSGRQTITFAGTAGIITSMGGSLSGDVVTLRWSSLPATDQGRATFQYLIPTDAMYGTGIVVSELSYDISNGGSTVTQTARLVDWFNMKPPEREVPRPPIYTIQIVSWFNEA